MSQYENTYRHCGHEWRDVWDSGCDDECPECGAPIEPVASRLIPETIEYSVCEDCLHAIALGEDGDECTPHIERELAGRNGYFSAGVAPTEEDPDGNGYDEFSWHDCELCRSSLGGSRHGVTLTLQPVEGGN